MNLSQSPFDSNGRPLHTAGSRPVAFAYPLPANAPTRPAASNSIAAASPPPARPPRPALTSQQMQERIAAIVKHPLTSGYEGLALALCSDTSLSIEQAIAALKAAHQDNIEEVEGNAMLAKVIALHNADRAPKEAARLTDLSAAVPSSLTTANVRADGSDMDEAAGQAMLGRVLAAHNGARRRRA